MEKIVFSEGLIGIAEYAFLECPHLKRIDLPNSLRFISFAAFSGCSHLTEVNFGHNLLRIDFMAFSNCYKLKSIKIPNSIKHIEACAFYNCSQLNEIHLPNKGFKIFADAFNCTAYANNKDNFIDDGLYIDNHLIKAVNNNAIFKIRKGTINIAAEAFKNSRFSKIIVNREITHIQEKTFADCYCLIDVVLPKSLIYIGPYAFANSAKIKYFEIPESIKTIDYGAFAGTQPCSIKLPSKPIRLFNIFDNNVPDSLDYCWNDSLMIIDRHIVDVCHTYSDIIIPKGTISIPDDSVLSNNITIPSSMKLINKPFTKYQGSKFRDYSKVRIRGVSNSISEKFAKKYHLEFEPIMSKMEYILNDDPNL